MEHSDVPLNISTSDNTSTGYWNYTIWCPGNQQGMEGTYEEKEKGLGFITS